MRKIYAVIKPAYVGDSENPFFCIDLVVILWHRASYERVSGYSLGHPVLFYADLNGAVQSKNRSGYAAIFELDVDELGHITGISSIECSRTEKKLVLGTQFFSSVKIPVWSRKEIQSHEMTPGAMTELQRQYNSSELAKAGALASALPLEEIETESCRSNQIKL